VCRALAGHRPEITAAGIDNYIMLCAAHHREVERAERLEFSALRRGGIDAIVPRVS
jgi:hypothetical protein